MKGIENERKALRNFSNLYLMLAGLTLTLGILGLIFPDSTRRIIESKYGIERLKYLSPGMLALISYIVGSLIYVWQQWLLKRVADNKSDGKFVMVVLVISIILSLLALTGGYNVSALLGLLVDAFSLQLIYKIRIEK